MTSEATHIIGSGGRLNPQAAKIDDNSGDGFPWLPDLVEEKPEPNVVRPKIQEGLAVAPPASHATPPLLPTSNAREIFSTGLEIAGIVTLAVGCFLISPAVGLIVAGLAMVLLGVATSDLGK